jgi:hypothetical protein
MMLCRRLLVLRAVGRGLEQVPCSVVGVWRFHVDMHEERACSPSDMRAYADGSIATSGPPVICCLLARTKNSATSYLTVAGGQAMDFRRGS